jgi:hypothetical protein
MKTKHQGAKHMPADELSMALFELLRKVDAEGGVDFLREAVRAMAQALMEREVPQHVQAGQHPYGWLDAPFVKVRQHGKVVSMAVVMATSVRETGDREVLGCDIGPSEDGAFWGHCLQQLVARGLHGVQVVIRDAQVSAAPGGGASWGYLLRNGSLALRIRRKPLGGIIAQAQFASECLWRLTPLAALNQLDAFIKQMWGQTHGHWQNSQVHLCHDVMNCSIELEQLERYVSRSRTQAIFDAAQAEIAEKLGQDADLYPGMDWGEIYGGDAACFVDPLLALGEELDLVAEPVEERQVSVYRYGRRLSGVAWSQGGDISLVHFSWMQVE